MRAGRVYIWIAVGVMLMSGAAGVEARRNRLTLKNKSESTTVSRPWERTISCETDSVEFGSLRKDIVFSGYDKSISSANERWFVQNKTVCRIRSLNVEISYYTPEGRLLHRREVTLHTDIPPGETRIVEVKSFDRQKNFYYHKSALPKRGGIPFDVKIRLLSITLDNQDYEYVLFHQQDKYRCDI